MNTESTVNPLVSFVACVGLDWGDQQHAFALNPQSPGAPVETGDLVNSPEVLHTWLQGLAHRFQSQPVALAVETSRGPLIHIFAAYPWLTVFPIHPATSARYRKAFRPSGATDDLPDALTLLELVRGHREKLRPLPCQDAVTSKLDALVQLRRDAVDRRTQVILQLEALLKSYYPQALALIGGSLTTELALAFLKRWPDPVALKATRASSLKTFYYQHSLRSQQLVQERLQLHSQMVLLTTDPDVLEIAVLHLRLLLDQLRTFQHHLAGLEQRIATLFKDHEEAYLFRDLPGAGAALQPRLLVAFGQDRSLYPDPASLQKYAGLAPVIEKSGRQCWIHWRWHAPTFLRQTFVEWAGQTVVYSTWARAYYQRMKTKGKNHHVILRALAFKWIRILWKCWQCRTPYDETRYLAQLHRRKSPYATPIAA